MKHLRIRRAVGGAIVALGLAGALLPTAALGSPDNPNHPDYWKARYPNAVACYKYDPPGESNAHGFLVDNGLAVMLNDYQDSWPGDRWEVLIVNGGPGDRVYELPVAGVAYYPPLNPGGNKPEVSHWIVCKGETPDTSTTLPPETTVPSDTTVTTEPTDTTVPSDTTVTTEPSDTTVPADTTVTTEPTDTTVPADTTVTTEPSDTTATTTAPESTVTTTADDNTGSVPPVVKDETVTSVDDTESDTDDETEDTLPFTGLGTDGIAGAGVLALLAGAGLVLLSRRGLEESTD